MRVWVAGAAGMLGTQVVDALLSAGITVFASDREVDITDNAAVMAYLAAHENPGWIVNCAAWTAVDAAETNRDAAFALNAAGPAVLGNAAARSRARLVHISTDYVFDGRASEPYRPDAPVGPQSVYGQSKLAGEIAVRNAVARHIIIRTAWLYGPNGPNFVSNMLRLMRERAEVGVVADQHGSPTYTKDLASAVARVVSSGGLHKGTWHYTNSGQTTWYKFALAIQDMGLKTGLLQNKCRIIPLTTAQYPTPAARPAYSVLDASSFETDFGVSIPCWHASLEQFMLSNSRSGG